MVVMLTVFATTACLTGPATETRVRERRRILEVEHYGDICIGGHC